MRRDSFWPPSLFVSGFHDCVGGCDGCINLNDPDNNGLDIPIEALQDIVGKYHATDGLSTADIWALAALTAAEVSQPSTGKILFPFEWYGRVDCVGPDTTSSKFPSPNLSTEGLLDFFDTTFDFNAEETVAIMGAHTLGVAKRENSGFEGDAGWVPQEGLLTNNYYTQVLGANWIQFFVDNSDLPGIPDRFQWKKGTGGGSGGGGGFGGMGSDVFMLDSDLAIARDFGESLDAETGEVTCTIKPSKSGCPFANTIDIAELYRNDNQQWVEDFRDAFTKMLVTGYIRGGVLRTPSV